uniref:glucan endo-1,3-beta-D-glucosidase n=1 Tax=Bruguiera sexangula TaxID=98584 RepID=A0A7T3UT18_9ROSI|nr:hypothetical protein KQ580_mgp35 [Bruguiera sexangula]QPZ76279.1 hypothetical protein [Bruguiera sexangula]
MMVDAVITSLAVAGHENIPVVVAETGWPSSGDDPGEVDATPAYAEMYIKGLVNHLRSGLGTPLRKEGVAETTIYELLDKVNFGNKKRTWRPNRQVPDSHLDHFHCISVFNPNRYLSLFYLEKSIKYP